MKSKLFLCLVWVMLSSTVCARIDVPGEGVFTYADYAPYSDKPIDVHYFIPSDGDAATMPILFVMQGADRGWTCLMKTWKQDAQKYRFIVVIPVFTKELYPVEEYQEMGVYSEAGTLNAPGRTAAILIDKVFERFREEIGGRQQRYSFYGHSAGGQFVHRALLLHDSPYVERSVVGSPGWYTFPDNSEMRYPYGVTDLPYINEDDLRRFVTREAWVQVSDGDTLRESFLRKTPEAELQGRNREERGKSFYASLCKTATDLGVENGWKFVEEHDVAHHSSGMGKRAVKYLFPDLVRRVDCKEVMTPAEVITRLQDLLADHKGRARMEVLGQTPFGQDIPVVYVGNRNDGKLRVWIEAGLHGNEPAGVLTVCQFVDYLLNSLEGRDVCSRLSFMIVPMANVDGYSRHDRLSGTGNDLNRDQALMTDTVTWILKRAYASWKPELAIDIHEYRPLRKDFARMCGKEDSSIAIAQDILLLPSGHPNVDPAIRALNDTLQRQIRRDLDAVSYTHGFYFTAVGNEHDGYYIRKDGGDPRSSTTFQALTNAVSLFFEVKGIGLDDELLPRRADVGLVALRSAIRKAASISPYIKEQVQLADHRACEASRPLVARSHPKEIQTEVMFENLDAGCFFKQLVTARDAMQQVIDLVKPRPAYYRLPHDAERAKQRLQTLGIVVDGDSIPVGQQLGNLVVTLLDPESQHFAFEGLQIVAVEK
ncbi:MAG: succinylglutamate desuccinylase/aspartoacylase family protein [Bacteroidales bacterium]|nr:succinylglutamate desuccinylase/aspartoacylase family protein [Bacteroidales bacterium]